MSLDLHYVPVNVHLQFFGRFSAFFLLAMLILNGQASRHPVLATRLSTFHCPMRPSFFSYRAQVAPTAL